MLLEFTLKFSCWPWNGLLTSHPSPSQTIGQIGTIATPRQTFLDLIKACPSPTQVSMAFQDTGFWIHSGWGARKCILTSSWANQTQFICSQFYMGFANVGTKSHLTLDISIIHVYQISVQNYLSLITSLGWVWVPASGLHFGASICFSWGQVSRRDRVPVLTLSP